MEANIRCANCGADLSHTPSVGYYRFMFCIPVNFTDDRTCMGKFSNDLWRSAERARMDSENKAARQIEAVRPGQAG